MSSGEKVGVFFSLLLPSPTQSPKDRTNTEHKANHPSQPTSSLPDSHTAIVDLASEGQYSFAASIFGISLLLTWGIGLTPPVIIRYALVRAPLKKWTAIGICFFLLIVNLTISLKVNEGEHSPNAHPALILVAAASYWILRKAPRKLPPQSAEENTG